MKRIDNLPQFILDVFFSWISLAKLLVNILFEPRGFMAELPKQWMESYLQKQYTRHLIMLLVLRPPRGIFLTVPSIDVVCPFVTLINCKCSK